MPEELSQQSSKRLKRPELSWVSGNEPEWADVRGSWKNGKIANKESKHWKDSKQKLVERRKLKNDL